RAVLRARQPGEPIVNHLRDARILRRQPAAIPFACGARGARQLQLIPDGAREVAQLARNHRSLGFRKVWRPRAAESMTTPDDCAIRTTTRRTPSPARRARGAHCPAPRRTRPETPTVRRVPSARPGLQ